MKPRSNCQIKPCWSNIAQDPVTALAISHLKCWTPLSWKNQIIWNAANTEDRPTRSASIQWTQRPNIPPESTSNTEKTCSWTIKPERREKKHLNVAYLHVTTPTWSFSGPDLVWIHYAVVDLESPPSRHRFTQISPSHTSEELLQALSFITIS